MQAGMVVATAIAQAIAAGMPHGRARACTSALHLFSSEQALLQDAAHGSSIPMKEMSGWSIKPQQRIAEQIEHAREEEDKQYLGAWPVAPCLWLAYPSMNLIGSVIILYFF